MQSLNLKKSLINLQFFEEILDFQVGRESEREIKDVIVGSVKNF